LVEWPEKRDEINLLFIYLLSLSSRMTVVKRVVIHPRTRIIESDQQRLYKLGLRIGVIQY